MRKQWHSTVIFFRFSFFFLPNQRYVSLNTEGAFGTQFLYKNSSSSSTKLCTWDPQSHSCHHSPAHNCYSWFHMAMLPLDAQQLQIKNPTPCVPPRKSPCLHTQLWPGMCCLKSLHCFCYLKRLSCCFFRAWKGVFGKPTDFNETYYCLWIKGSLDGSY